MERHQTVLSNDYATTDGLFELVEYEGIIMCNLRFIIFMHALRSQQDT